MGLYCLLSSQTEEIPNSSSSQTSEFQINPVSAGHRWPWGFSPWLLLLFSGVLCVSARNCSLSVQAGVTSGALDSTFCVRLNHEVGVSP